MRTNRTKLFAIISFALPLLFVAYSNGTPVRVVAYAFEEPATTYKAKCASCHTPTASKFFDPAKSDDEHVQVILKGKKGAKPPYMPGYEEKGMTAEEAKALAVYMRTLKPAAN